MNWGNWKKKLKLYLFVVDHDQILRWMQFLCLMLEIQLHKISEQWKIYIYNLHHVKHLFWLDEDFLKYLSHKQKLR